MSSYEEARIALRDMLADWGRYRAYMTERVAAPRVGERGGKGGGREDRWASAMTIETLLAERGECRSALEWYWSGVARGVGRDWGGYVDAEEPGLEFEQWAAMVGVVSGMVAQWEAWAVAAAGLWLGDREDGQEPRGRSGNNANR